MVDDQPNANSERSVIPVNGKRSAASMKLDAVTGQNRRGADEGFVGYAAGSGFRVLFTHLPAFNKSVLGKLFSAFGG